MNLVVVRGRLMAEPQWTTTRDGGALCAFDLAVGEGRERAVVPVTWVETPAATVLRPGDELVVRGRVAKRFLSGASGVRARTDVLAEQVVSARRGRQVERLMLTASTALHGA